MTTPPPPGSAGSGEAATIAGAPVFVAGAGSAGSGSVFAGRVMVVAAPPAPLLVEGSAGAAGSLGKGMVVAPPTVVRPVTEGSFGSPGAVVSAVGPGGSLGRRVAGSPLVGTGEMVVGSAVVPPLVGSATTLDGSDGSEGGTLVVPGSTGWMMVVAPGSFEAGGSPAVAEMLETIIEIMGPSPPPPLDVADVEGSSGAAVGSVGSCWFVVAVAVGDSGSGAGLAESVAGTVCWSEVMVGGASSVGDEEAGINPPADVRASGGSKTNLRQVTFVQFSKRASTSV